MSHIPEHYKRSVLVLGCGNILFGDDGFGPATIAYLKTHYHIPDDACLMDVGAGIRRQLFDLIISDAKPQRLIVIDAIDIGKKPGEVFHIPVKDLPTYKIQHFSFHQAPSSNLLKELHEHHGIQVVVIAGQVERISKNVELGLSQSLQSAIPKAAGLVMKNIETPLIQRS